MFQTVHLLLGRGMKQIELPDGAPMQLLNIVDTIKLVHHSDGQYGHRICRMVIIMLHGRLLTATRRLVPIADKLLQAVDQYPQS